MADFPTLSINPSYPIGETREDSAIVTEFDAGYDQSRAKYSRVRYIFTINYKLIPSADKTLLTTFITTVNGRADAFNWTHPQSSTVYSVKFNKIPEFQYVAYNYYDCNFTVKTI
jgi:hypothetical protein